MLKRRSADAWLIGTILAFSSLADPLLASNRTEVVIVNGVPLHLRSSTELGDPDMLAQRLARSWAESGPAPLTMRLRDGRIILGRQRHAFHETVSLQPGRSPGSTRLKFAVRDLREPIDTRSAMPFVAPADWQRISLIRHGRSRNAATTVIFRSHRPALTAIDQLRQALARAGWSAPRADSVDRAVISSRRGGQRLEAAVAAARGGVSIVIQIDGSEN